LKIGGKKASKYCKYSALRHFCSNFFQGSEKLAKNITTNKSYSKNKQKAILKGFIETDAKYLEKFETDGSTALLVLLLEDNTMYVANAGSSQ
jgi:serine/threonine protein phosphatase PrpC